MISFEHYRHGNAAWLIDLLTGAAFFSAKLAEKGDKLINNSTAGEMVHVPSLFQWPV